MALDGGIMFKRVKYKVLLITKYVFRKSFSTDQTLTVKQRAGKSKNFHEGPDGKSTGFASHIVSWKGMFKFPK